MKQIADFLALVDQYVLAPLAELGFKVLAQSGPETFGNRYVTLVSEHAAIGVLADRGDVTFVVGPRWSLDEKHRVIGFYLSDLVAYLVATGKARPHASADIDTSGDGVDGAAKSLVAGTKLLRYHYDALLELMVGDEEAVRTRMRETQAFVLKRNDEVMRRLSKKT